MVINKAEEKISNENQLIMITEFRLSSKCSSGWEGLYRHWWLVIGAVALVKEW